MTTRSPVRDEVLKHLRAGSSRVDAWRKTQKRFESQVWRKISWSYVRSIARRYERGDLK